MQPFEGYPKETIRFLRALKRNNDRNWFLKHKSEYENFIKVPCSQFVDSIAPELKSLCPFVSVSFKSMHRIYRDTRFSENKTPYKTYVSFSFKDKRGDPEFRPGFYLGFDPSGVSYGAGIYSFSTQHRDHFRQQAVLGDSADELSEISQRLKKTRGWKLNGKTLKRLPIGFDHTHPNSDFLLYTGLYASYEEDLPTDFYSSKFIKRVSNHYRKVLPIFDWLGKMSRSAPKSSERFIF